MAQAPALGTDSAKKKTTAVSAKSSSSTTKIKKKNSAVKVIMKQSISQLEKNIKLPSEEVPQPGMEAVMITMHASIFEGIPPGLEPLVGIESVLIQQELEIFEGPSMIIPKKLNNVFIILGVETSNRYHVFNNFGTRMYFAGESSDYCDRQCLGPNRPFDINLFDGMGQIVMAMTRTCNAQLGWWGARNAGSNITVTSEITGELFGSVVQKWSFFTPAYIVLDGVGNEVMAIRGPSFSNTCCCCCKLLCDVYFPVYILESIATAMEIQIREPVTGQVDRPGQPLRDKTLPGYVLIGGIMKRFQIQEIISDANMFGILFSPQLEPRLKAVLIGATFCIDFSYFESGRYGFAGFELLTILIFIGILFLLTWYIYYLYTK